MPYVGPAPNPGQNREVDDISSGFNGSEVNFTLQVNSQNVSPGSPNNIIVSLGGVVQNPSTDYNIAASTITFTTAPASGLSFFGVVLGQQVDIQSLADGTSPTMSAPSITGDLSIADKIVHTGDTNTAIRFPAADTVTAETGGVERLRINSTGQTIVGDSVAQLSTSSERPFQVHSINGPKIAIGRNDTSISEGNTIGGIEFYGNDANGTFVNTASIIVDADGAHGDDDKPTRMEFYTTADGGSSASERVRIDSTGDLTIKDGDLVIGTSGHGIDFGVTGNGSGTMTSELFSDYEEGTWTPTTPSGGGGWNSVSSAMYRKVGKIVFLTFYGGLASQTSTNAIKIGGFPYAAAGGNHYSYLYGRVEGYASSDAVWQVTTGSSEATLFFNNNVVGYNNFSANAYVLVSGFYFTDS